MATEIYIAQFHIKNTLNCEELLHFPNLEFTNGKTQG